VEEQHRLLMECVTDYAIFFLDPHGNVATWNVGAERTFGYPEAEIVGRHFSCFFTAEDVQQGQPNQELQTAAGTGRASDDRWLVRKDGARLWCNGVTTALRDGAGRLRGFAKVLRDRTEWKRLEEALHQRAQELAQEGRQKDDFLAVLAHELRNPLAPIRNALQAIRLGGHDPP
jgi:PAS domain S-box-containing protein